MSETEWVAKATELGRRVVKVNAKIAPQVGKTLFTTTAPSVADAESRVQLEVIVFCLHVCERMTRERFGGAVPVTLTSLLVERTAGLLVDGTRDDLAAEKLRHDLRTLYAARNETYKGYGRLRAKKGESEHGTLVDGFGKMLTNTYSGKNALARAMLSAQGIELVKTMHAFLDEVGLRAA